MPTATSTGIREVGLDPREYGPQPHPNRCDSSPRRAVPMSIRGFIAMARYRLATAAGVAVMAVGLLALTACTANATSSSVAYPRTLATATVTAAEGGIVRAPNGVMLVAPPHLISTKTARASIVEVTSGIYNVHIAGKWQGTVTVEIPTQQDHPTILHRIDGTWVVEYTTKVDGYAVTNVTSLSWFMPALLTLGICLVGVVGVVLVKEAAASLALACLIRAGVIKVAASIAVLIYSAIFKYNPCKPLAITNLPVALTDIAHACTLSDPTPSAVAPPANPAPPQAAPQPAPAPAAPAQPAPAQPAPAPGPPAPSAQAHAWVTRAGDTVTYHWENIPGGMWSQVDRFRCWRYTRDTHPGGWATDGCGEQTGFAGYPSGTGSVSFSYGGATDSFSIEPWKYGPWLNVGESWYQP